jgi:PAS domain-containing protein
MFGYESPEELIRSINDVTRETYVDGNQRREVLRRIKETRGYVQAEVTYRRKDGSHFICNLYMRAVSR